jgi:hypothetical protein
LQPLLLLLGGLLPRDGLLHNRLRAGRNRRRCLGESAYGEQRPPESGGAEQQFEYSANGNYHGYFFQSLCMLRLRATRRAVCFRAPERDASIQFGPDRLRLNASAGEPPPLAGARSRDNHTHIPTPTNKGTRPMRPMRVGPNHSDQKPLISAL